MEKSNKNKKNKKIEKILNEKNIKPQEAKIKNTKKVEKTRKENNFENTKIIETLTNTVNNENSEETKIVETPKINSKKLSKEEKLMKKNEKKAKKAEKKEKKNQSKARRIIKTIIKIIIVLIILCTLIGGGLVAGLFMGIFGENFGLSEDELAIKNLNTYFYDSEGNQISMVYSNENRMVVSYADMNPLLPEAFIAIEDERFEQHNGVDIKRSGAAILTYALNRGSSSFGGSTITQQLVKNVTDEKEDSGLAGATRKIKEMARAIELEKKLSKNQIIEQYLNILFLGGDVCGVQTASYYYFNKSCKELTLEECAFLAGITHIPNAYNPYKEGNPNADKIKTRTKVVLRKMLELGKIDQTQYDEAVAATEAGLNFKKGEMVSASIQSYFIEAAMNDVVEDLMKEKNIPRSMAQKMVYSGGYHIYTTQVTSIQNEINATYNKDSYFETSKKSGAMSQSGMAIVDYTNGHVVGIAGGRGEKKENSSWNRAVSTIVNGERRGTVRQTGSTMKPLSVYAPAIEKNIITAASVYEDANKTFKAGGKNWYPKNYYSGFKGLSTVRYAIEISQNIVPVEILYELGFETSYTFLESLGISSLTDADKAPAPLGLGGLTQGISPLEMAAAYGTIANDGKYITPKFYTKVTDNDGKLILSAKQETRQVMSVEAAYVMKNLLTQPVIGTNGATATYCRISGMDVAAKTGTTNDDKDRWLCGFTPYYAAATWYGFDSPEEVKKGGTNPAGKLWSDIMKNIHKGLESKKFIRPAGVVNATVCRDSGMLPGELCSLDSRGNRAISDIFIKGTVPTEKCNLHVKTIICADTGVLPAEHCPNKVEVVLLSNEYKWSTTNGQYVVPTATCSAHISAPEVPVVPDPTPEPPVTTPTPPPEPPKSSNANLKNIKLPAGYTLAPVFSPTTLTGYAVTVANTINELAITAEVEDSKAKAEITGNKNLQTGANTVTIVVTAEDKTTKKTYTLTITKEV